MPRTLTIEITDDDYQQLQRWAAERSRTPEALAGEWLHGWVQVTASDPLLQLAGIVDSDITDVGERHDEYIGQAIYDEMQGRSGA
jgi:hypothetical protein